MTNQIVPEKEITISEFLTLPIKTRDDVQRFTPWPIEKQQLLIHSIFHNSQIGKLAWKDDDYTLLDGRQIYQAIHDFVNNKFDLEGMTYDEMRQEQKTIFGEYRLHYYDLNIQFEDAIETIKRLNGNN